MLTCPKCRTALAAKISRCPKCGAALTSAAPARSALPPRPGRAPARPPEKPRNRSLLYGAIAAGALLLLVIVSVVMVSTGSRETQRLARKAEEMVKTEERLQAGAPKPAFKPRSHRDERLGYEIPIPEGWDVAPRSESSIVLQMTKPGSAETAFVLTIRDLPPDSPAWTIAWEERLDAIVRELRSSMDELRPMRREEGTCCGHRAFLVTYACRDKNLSMTMLQYLAAANNRTYVLTWTTTNDLYPALGPLFERTSKAFILFEPPGTVRPSPATIVRPVPAGPPVKGPPPPDPLKEAPALFRHDSLEFTIPVPAGWKSKGIPRQSSFRTGVLSMTDDRTGGRCVVTVEPLPSVLAEKEKKADLQAWRKDHRGMAYGPVTREEPGTCSGSPALLVVYSSRSLAYFVAAPELLYEVQWDCLSQEYPRLEPLFERCSKGLVLPAPKAPAKPAGPPRNPRLDPVWFPSIHEDKSLGFSIPVPMGWKAEGKPRASEIAEVLTMNDDLYKTGRMSVRVEPLPPGLKDGGKDWGPFLKGTQAWGEERGSWRDVKIEEQSPSTCCGNPALKVVWRYRTGEIPWNTVAYYVAAKGILFRVEWNFWPQNYRVARALVDVCHQEFTVPQKE